MHILYTRSIHGTELEEEIILTGEGKAKCKHMLPKSLMNKSTSKQGGGEGDTL